jgi:hypothetical protein
MQNKDLELIKLSLFKDICNATGVYRKTVSKEEKKNFDKNAIDIIKDLISKVDSNQIKNADIRDAIKKLSELSGFKDRVGSSQKVINVYLKYYCVVANKSEEIIKELDCPIDSRVRKEYRLEDISIKNMTFNDYTNYQNVIEARYKIRVIADVYAYDEIKVNSKV